MENDHLCCLLEIFPFNNSLLCLSLRLQSWLPNKVSARNPKDGLAPISAARKEFFFWFLLLQKTAVSAGQAVISTASLSNTHQRYMPNKVSVSRINVFMFSY